MCIKQQYFVIPKAFYVDDSVKNLWACCSYNRTGNQYNIDISGRNGGMAQARTTVERIVEEKHKFEKEEIVKTYDKK